MNNDARRDIANLRVRVTENMGEVAYAFVYCRIGDGWGVIEINMFQEDFLFIVAMELSSS